MEAPRVEGAVSGKPGPASRRVETLVLLSALLVVGAFFSLWARRQYRWALHTWQTSLSMLADDRVAAVEAWLDGIHADSQILANFPTFQVLVGDGSSPPGEAPFPATQGPRRHLEQIFAEFAEPKRYRGIAVVDRAGSLLAASPGTPELPEACRRWSLEGGWEADHFRFFSEAGGGVLLVHAHLAGPRDRPAAALFLFADPKAWLYPTLTRPPLTSFQGEVFLVQREGDRFRILSPVGFSQAPPLSTTLSAGDEGTPLALAVNGAEGFGVFQNYRGRQVLAVLRRIRGSRWGLVAKADRAEVLAEVRSRVAWTGLFLVLFLLLAGLSAYAFQRRRRLLFLEAVTLRDERYRLLRDEAGDPLLFVRPDGMILEANRAAEEVYGYGPGEMAGLSVAQIRAPERRADVPAQLREALSAGTVFETVHLRKDGTPFTVEVRSRPARLGGETLLVSAIRDITERKRVEEELLRSEARYRSLFENMTAGFVLFEVIPDEAGTPADLVILAANQGFERTTGLKVQEVLGRRLTSVLPGIDKDSADWIGTYGRVALGGEAKHFEQASELLGSYYSVTAYRPAPNQCAVTFTDVTAHKRAEEALRESEARYKALSGELEEKVGKRTEDLVQALRRMASVAEEARLAHERVREGEEVLRLCLEGARAGSWVWSPSTGEVRLSDPLCRLLGLTDPRISLEGFLSAFEAGERESLLKSMWKALKGGENFTMEVRWAGEEIRWFRLSGKGFSQEKGERRLLGLALDATEEREAMENLRRQAEEISALNRELQRANAELEAFSYSVSHDLRAPLRALDGFSRALEEDFGEALGEKGRDYLRRIAAAARRMALLIDDLLQLSRVGRAELHRTEVDLSALARDVLAELRRREPQREVEAYVEEGMRAEGDPRLLQVVLENLLGNAFKYTSKKDRARIAFRREGSAFVVEDDGAGFDMRFADKLFTPFQRLHSLQEFPGTGVGLALVARIVRRHGGETWARGEPNRGAAFFFTLGSDGESDPAGKASAGASPSTPPPRS